MRKLLFSFLALSIGYISSAQVVNITLESTDLAGTVGTTDFTGFTQYRIFAEMTSAADEVLNVQGDESCPGNISTTTSFFRHPASPGVVGSGLAQGFFGFIPELRYHSVVTIGRATDASLGIPFAEDATGYVAATGNAVTPLEGALPADAWITAFAGGGNIEWNSFNGGSYFTTLGGVNLLGQGVNNSVLLGAFTTAGDFSYAISIGSKADGVNAVTVTNCVDNIDNLIYPLAGCMDDTACNYDEFADTDGGTCEFTSCMGCTNATACNFSSDATVDDGSCEFTSCVGCIDDTACNYDVDATIEDDSCIFAEGCDVCDGAGGVTDNPEIGDECDDDDDTTSGDVYTSCDVCEGTAVPGCTDDTACNYDANATVDDNSCVLAEGCDVCDGAGGVTDNPEIGDSCDDGDDTTVGDVYTSCDVCEGTTVPGCTDDTACNYDASATVDDNSCVLAEGCDVCDGVGGVTDNPEIGDSCDDGDDTTVGDVYTSCDVCEGTTVPGCTDDTACNYDASATVDDNSCVFAEGCDVCDGAGGVTDNPEIGNSCDDGDDTTVGDVYTSCDVCEGTTVPGCTDDTACNYDASATVDDNSCVLAEGCDECDGAGGVTDNPEIGDACDDGDDTTIGDVYTACGVCGGTAVPGCTDDTACNYDAAATVDDNSCVFAEGCDECDGAGGVTDNPEIGEECDDADATTINDMYIECDVCAGTRILGCTNPIACNYDSTATADDNSCILAEGCDECDGAGGVTDNPEIGDACDDGDDTTVGDIYIDCDVCLGRAILGCTDDTACNYDPTATVDDNSCVFAEGCDECDGAGGVTDNPEIGDSCDDGDDTTVGDVYTACGVCGGTAIPGCTDDTACNYDAAATVDDNSCVFAEGCDECDGAGGVTDNPEIGDACDDSDDTTVGDAYVDCDVCLGRAILGCTNDTACNYDTTATVDDNSCVFAEDCDECDGAGGVTDNPEIGDACDDGDDTTVGDVYTACGVCGGTAVPGCTDDTACNYDTTATIDDNSCVFAEGCDVCDGAGGVTDNPEIGEECDDDDATTINDMYIECDVCAGTRILGCTNPIACNYDSTATADDDSCILAEGCDECDGAGGVTDNPEIGDPCDDGDDTTVGDVYIECDVCLGRAILGCTNPIACNYDATATVDDGSCILPDGCIDPTACNYNPSATCDDHSCEYQSCGVACTDPNACNYNPDFCFQIPFDINDPVPPGVDCFDFSECLYEDECGNCGGTELAGCMDPNACNFDGSVSCEDDSCEYVSCVEGEVNADTSDPCVCNFDANANTGFFSDVMTISTNPPTTGFSFTVSASAGVIAGSGADGGDSFADNGDGTYSLAFNYEDGETWSIDADCAACPIPTLTGTNAGSECQFGFGAFNNIDDVCDTDTPIELIPLTGPAGGTFSIDGGNPGLVGNTFDPSVSGAGTFTIIYEYIIYADAVNPECLAIVSSEVTVLESGCTDTNADNFNPLAECNDGSCQYSCDGVGPCEAFRWEEGGTWNIDGTIDDTPNGGDGTQNMADANGVIRCGSSAETQSQLQPQGCYNASVFDIDVNSFTCVEPSSGNVVNPINPTHGEPLIWMNFDVRPNAGTFQIQINDNSGDEIAWALYSSDNPTSGVSLNGATGEYLSGNCSSVTLRACGVESSSTWNTLPLPNFTSVTNYYIAIWDQDADGDLSVNNFKARFGCGDSDIEICNIGLEDVSTTCNDDGTYSVIVDVIGLNGEYVATDGNSIEGTSDPICLSNNGTNDPVTSGSLTLTYASGTPYSITVAEVSPSTISGCSEPVNTEDCVITGIGGNVTFGCTDPTACNYDTNAICDDNSCVPCSGCTNPSACNYDPSAVTDDGSCIVPEYICPSGQTFECVNDVPIAMESDVSIINPCGTVTVTISESHSGNGCVNSPLIITRTYTISDDLNTEVCEVEHTVIDTTPPLIICPQDVEHKCDEVVDYGEATATDNCSDAIITFSDQRVSDGCITSILRTWVATDVCGNAIACAQTITILDTTAPVINCPDDVEHECDEVVDYGEATATDNCNDVTITSSDVETTDDCETIIERTWTATDICGNSSRCVQTITIYDTTPPVINLPDDISVDISCEEYVCGIEAGFAFINGLLTPDEEAAFIQCNEDLFFSLDIVPTSVTDNCDNNVEFVPISLVPVVHDGCVEYEGSSNVKFSLICWFAAIDDCGNEADRVFTVLNIVDHTAPVINCPDDLTFECDAVGDFGMATATDDCPGPIGISHDDVETGDDCETIITRTWTATDVCGNSSSCVQTITIVDTTAPVITCPADVEYECHLQVLLVPATATDNCNGVTITSSDVTTGDDCETVITRTWTATDACGNSSSCVQTLTILDTTPPVITCPDDVDTSCDILSAGFGEATATDNCNDVTITFDDVTSGNGCENGIQRTWTATDACGNVSRCIQTIIVSDTTPPVITCPADVEHECDEIVDYGEATATDNCNDVTITSNDVETTDDCETIIERTWTATDICGNSSRCVQTITIVDTTAPVINLPDDISVDISCEEYVCGIEAGFAFINGLLTPDQEAEFIQCNEDLFYSLDVVPTSVTDNCDNDVEFVPISLVPVVHDGCVDYEGSSNVKFSLICWFAAIDDCGNEADRVFTVLNIVDHTAPVISCPDDLTFECAAATDFGVATATDDCPGVITISHEDVETGDECETVISRTWTATDVCGNSSSCVQTIVISDTTAPVIVCPADVEHECDEQVDYGEATATDNCSGVTINSSDVTTGDDCKTVIERTWFAVDDCGHSSSCVQTITIVDTTAPVINLPDDISADINCDEYSCGLEAGFAFFNGLMTPEEEVDFIKCNEDLFFSLDIVPTGVTDNCDTDVDYAPVELEAVIHDGCQDEYEGSNNVRFSIICWFGAMDDCGNEAERVYTVLNFVDNTAPVITCPDDVTFECDAVGDFGLATATDDCFTAPIVTHSDVETGDKCETTITRTWTATDDCGNSSSCVQTITIVDTTAPVITCPDDVEYECELQVLLLPATATDNCNDFSITSSDVTTGNDCETIITRTWTATDDCGNFSSCVQTITIVDTTAPVITCPANITVECSDPDDYGMATATDNCNDVIVDYIDLEIPFDSCERTIERTWTATDNCGNQSSCIQVIVIVDTTAPIITCPDNVEHECDQDVDYGEATATDDCHGVTISSNDDVSEVDCLITITRTWTATDDCGNASECIQVITIVDTTAPVLSGTPSTELTINCQDEHPEVPEVTVTDNCDDDVTVSFEEIYEGFHPDPEAYENCEGIQPLNAEVDWAMALFDLPGHVDEVAYYNTVFAQVSFYEDSGDGLEALLTGTVYDQSNPSGGWHINIPLTAGKGWEAWSAIEGNDYKDDFNLVGDAYLDWTYYLINSDGAYLEGWGDLDGSFLDISHTPVDYSIGWQHGVGANNVGPHLGLGGWMHFEGIYVNSELDIDEEVSGAGDVAIDLNCCPTYLFTRVWSSTDCAGNETTFTQEITVLGVEAQAAQECIADFNYDGGRTTTDLVIFLGDYGCFTGDCGCDLNDDGFTTSVDLTIFLMYYGIDCENHNADVE